MCKNNYREACEKIKNIQKQTIPENTNDYCIGYRDCQEWYNNEIKSILAQADTDNKHEPDHVADGGKKVA